MTTHIRQLQPWLSTAVDAAGLAGRLALEQMHAAEPSVKQGPTGSELVTQVDRLCQQVIIDRILRTFPDHGLIAEEGREGRLHKVVPKGGEGWWVIDPIDGTNNFAHGMPLFTISIAAMLNGEPVVGVIYDPKADLMFTAVQGGPARMNQAAVSCGNEPVNPFASVALDGHFGDQIPGWLGPLIRQCRFRNLGTTALHMAYVAAGGMAGAITGLPKLWDIAAGSLIVQSAGGVVTDWQGQGLWPMDLEGYEGHRLPLVAANPVAHGQILRIMADGM